MKKHMHMKGHVKCPNFLFNILNLIRESCYLIVRINQKDLKFQHKFPPGEVKEWAAARNSMSKIPVYPTHR